jgi:small-conductance mechanosensitive channel
LAEHQDNIIDAIANLATATAEDRRAVANLTDTNATLTKELATSNGKLVSALTLVNTLTKQLSDLRGNHHPRTPPFGPPERKHYCWTCGYRCEHSSWLCPTPAAGHQTRAKAADPMKGSTKNKPT